MSNIISKKSQDFNVQKEIKTPVSSNRGVTPPNPLKNNDIPFFDWYSGTFPVDKFPIDQLFQDLIDYYSIFVQANLIFIVDKPINRNYSRGVCLKSPSGEVFVRISFNDIDGIVGLDDDNTIFCQATSDYASDFRNFLCDEDYLKYFSLARADVAIDFIGKGLFEKFTNEMISLADKKNLKVDFKGDWARGKARTLYLGSRKSQFYIRAYEKGLERIQTGQNPNADPYWYRFEIEIKPHSTKKQLAASLSAFDLMNTTKTYKSLYEFFYGDFDGDFCSLSYSKDHKHDDIKKFHHMLKQYKNIINTAVENFCDGDFDKLGEFIKQELPVAISKK